MADSSGQSIKTESNNLALCDRKRAPSLVLAFAPRKARPLAIRPRCTGSYANRFRNVRRSHIPMRRWKRSPMRRCSIYHTVQARMLCVSESRESLPSCRMLAAAGDENSHDDNKEQENRRWPIQHKLTVRNDLTSRKYAPIFVRNHGSEKGGHTVQPRPNDAGPQYRRSVISRVLSR